MTYISCRELYLHMVLCSSRTWYPTCSCINFAVQSRPSTAVRQPSFAFCCSGSSSTPQMPFCQHTFPAYLYIPGHIMVKTISLVGTSPINCVHTLIMSAHMLVGTFNRHVACWLLYSGYICSESSGIMFDTCTAPHTIFVKHQNYAVQSSWSYVNDLEKECHC